MINISHDEVIDRLTQRLADLEKENVVLQLAVEKLTAEESAKADASGTFDDSEPF